MIELKAVSAVYQIPYPINGWLYRITIDQDGATVKRVPYGEEYWNHGIICQHLPKNETHFVPGIKAGRQHEFTSLNEAIDFIHIYKEEDQA